jgi:ribonuclease G
LRERVKHYKGPDPIFDHFGIETQIEKTFERKVWLKKGGYICVDHTEALVAIDVNTGRFVGKKNQEETIFRTNLEAAREIPRQLRLRDIGGIIVIDFIDMEIEANKRAVLDELRTELRADRASGWSR